MAVDDGKVVPIVGRDLLVVETAAGPRRLHNLIAERLAAELKVPTEALPPDFDTNHVICAYEKFHGNASTLSPRVVRIVKELKVPVPEPLRLLAEITKFTLFVSTSFDSLLEDAIYQARSRKPAVVAFPPASNLIDFDEALLEQNGSMVFHMLGCASASSSFALTEGQMLEQMHDFMSGPRRPDKLIARLKESHLLILGIDFPDWLVRFLLRFARAKPLWDSRDFMEVIADTGRSDLSVFLHHFSPEQSRLFTEGSAADFVRELHRRWMERNSTAEEPSPGGVGLGTEKPANMTPGSIFISYASEDRAEAFQLADALTAAGLEVWIDRRLRPGDDYNYLIERNIRESCAFVPVLSRHTQTSDARWFRKEWELATREKAGFYFGTELAFIFPVVVDGTPNSELIEFKRKLFARTAVPVVGGVAPPELIQELDQAQKAWRKQNIHV